jgi:hypothetical protein
VQVPRILREMILAVDLMVLGIPERHLQDGEMAKERHSLMMA